MCLMSQEWDRLARALHERRTALGLSRQRVADAAGVSLGSVKNLEQQGNEYKRVPHTLALIAKALGWSPESARAVMAGGEPTIINGETTPRIRDDEYELEVDPEVGTVVHNTVYEVIGVMEPD